MPRAADLLHPLTDVLDAAGIEVGDVGLGPWTWQDEPGKSVTETQFMHQVIDVAMSYGWRVHHETDSRRTDSGLPDLILVRPPRLVVLELKAPSGKRGVSETQRAWLADLTNAGVEVAVAGPGDLRVLTKVLSRPGLHLPTYDPGPVPILNPAEAREHARALAYRRRTQATARNRRNRGEPA